VSPDPSISPLRTQDSALRTRDWSPLEDLIPADLLKAEARDWAVRIGVELREIQVRSMKRKWASCSSKGRLSFNADLLRQPAAFRAEVIVHELVHLKVPNHGRLFRSLVRAYLQGVGSRSPSGGLRSSSLPSGAGQRSQVGPPRPG
jgi:predicted metal-dependent hydrolase